MPFPRQQNQPTVQYCVQASLAPSGLVIDRFTIEQVESGKGKGGLDHSNYNAVQEHLSELSEKTGLSYNIAHWGVPRDRSRWVAGFGFED